MAFAGAASAQSIDIPAALNPDLKAPPTIITAQAGHQFSVDAGGSGTKIARSNFMLGANHRIKLNDKTSLYVIGTYTLHQYDFDKKTFYQWDDIHRFVVAGLVGHDLNDKWRLIGGAMYRSWGQGGADYEDSITGGAIAGFDFHPNDDFSVGVLLGVFSALEKSPSLLAVPTVKWKFAKDWRLNVGLVSMLDPGIGAEVNWQVSKTISLGTGLTYQNRSYRLNDSNKVFGRGRSTGDGIGYESEVPVFAMLQWRPTPMTAIDLMSGVAFAGRVKVESSSGATVQSSSYDPAPFVGLKGQIAF
jgi:hypothetical protein